MNKKLLLFSYYLKMLAQKEQEMLRSDDFRIGLLAIIFADTRLFRRFVSGCSVEPICFCNPMYAQELFIYLCLDAEKHGDNLLKEFDFCQTLSFHPRFVNGNLYLQDMELSYFLMNKFYPPVIVSADIDRALLKKFGNCINEPNMLAKFHSHNNICQVCPKALNATGSCAETEMIDRALTRLADDPIMKNMLNLTTKCNLHAESAAFGAIKQVIASFPKK